MAQLEFFGAVRQVTGSQHIFESNEGYRIMVDCGLDLQGGSDSQTPFGSPPASIDSVLLTHAHIDHSGLLPVLAREGFTGAIYATHATYQLTRLLLFDTVRIMQRQFRKRNKPSWFFNAQDVENVLEQFITVDFYEKLPMSPDVLVQFLPAGHLLGAAMVSIKFDSDGAEQHLLFSGDLGRRNYPLLPDPVIPPQADFIVCESTYGGRRHQDSENILSLFAEIIEEACVRIPGRLIVPSFSIGRTQLFLYILNALKAQGKLPPIRIFTDSPLAHRSTLVHEDFIHEFNSEAQQFRAKTGTLFNLENLTFLPKMNSAEEIMDYREPCIILTSSGMVRGGKSMDHVMMNLSNPYCTILFIGYCAEGTFGRQLLDGASEVHDNNGVRPVLARIRFTDALSGHAGHDELVGFISNHDNTRLKRIFLVHGEESSMDALKQDLSEKGYDVRIPERSQRFNLN